MKLTSISVGETCPDCGAVVVSEERRNHHVHGGWFETRRYGCGAAWEYVPNFRETLNSSACPNSTASHVKLEKRKQLIEQLVATIDASDVDPDFSAEAKRSLKNILKWSIA